MVSSDEANQDIGRATLGICTVAPQGEVVLPAGLRDALIRLNSALPAQAISNAIDEIARDRSAMLAEAANDADFGRRTNGFPGAGWL